MIALNATIATRAKTAKVARQTRARASVKAVEPVPANEVRGSRQTNTDCGRAEKTADEARVFEMAKAKCVHPDRPVAKACGDCPRRK